MPIAARDVDDHALPRDRSFDQPRWWRDPLLALSSLVALGVYLPHGFDGYLSRDLGLYSYAGQQVADGVAPYVGVMNRAGPLAHLIPGIGAFVARLTGVEDLFGMRLLFMLISIACIGLAYLLGRDLFRSRLAGLASAGALLCCQGFIGYATYGPREKTSMVLFVLCALLAMVHQRWGTTGFFIALATLTWQPVFFAAMAGAVAAILFGVPTGRWRALARLVVGGLIPSAVTVAAYLLIGQLQVFIEDFLLINARYTHQISMLDHPGELWDNMVAADGWSLYVFLVGSVALLVLAVLALARRAERRTPLGAALVGMGVMLLVGVLWSIRAFNGYPDNFFMLPAAGLGIAGMAAAIVRHLSLRAALVTTLVWVLVATALSLSYSIRHRDNRLDEQRSEVAAVMARLPKGARILSVEAPQPLVLSHKRNLSRYQLFGNGLIDYVDAAWSGGRYGYGSWVARHQPAVVALGKESPPRWLRPMLTEYRLVGGSPGWDWYVRKDFGPETLNQLSAILGGRS